MTDDEDGVVAVAAAGGGLAEDERVGLVGKPEDRTGALAWQAAERVHVVTVAGEAPDTMIAIDAPEGMSVAQLLVLAEEGAKGTVVIEHAGVGDLAETVEIEAKDRSELTVVSVQEAERSARHVSHQRIRVGRDAKVRHIVVTLGGDAVRIATSSEFAGEGGDVELLGAYITEGGEHHEHRLFVDHNPPNCISRATYKGALQGEDAHSVWIGDVLIRPTAKNTDTYELNRNLVLTEGAKADSIPNLEIENGNIEGAGHASAIGRFDDEQLFYLRARGISEIEARRLVVLGFFNEIVAEIGVPEVEERLMAAIEKELEITGLIAARETDDPSGSDDSDDAA